MQKLLWQIRLGLQVIFGRYYIVRRYNHPAVGYSEVTLKHKTLKWKDAN